MSKNSKRRRIIKKQNFTDINSIRNDITKTKSPIIDRDSNGNITHKLYWNGQSYSEYWIEYMVNLPVHMYTSSGYECWWKYNNLNNISYFWDNTGYQETYKYYKNNITICTNIYGEIIKKVIDREKYKYITRDLFMSIF